MAEIDILNELRAGDICAGGECRIKNVKNGCLCAMAADEIERLRAERDHWKGLVARSDLAQFQH